ncbi:methyltransferase domain-containing protein [Hyphomicrobium sp. CS1GBMeth3]|uniref:methyltransferase domain-containing protein n=1 Tax=Hyphomicrobium sp. CS1GBMeth3 TaxID=1892845 RepID=UPI000930B097|nr:methyltransferase domain-containing protein [Hyphomicrobium sp. CS1GBMeth3]
MKVCRVCREAISAPAYERPAPALTSISTLIDVPTRVFVCDCCGHAQCHDLPDIHAFYDRDYRISLASDDHDQVFAVHADGTIIYRTDHQAEIALGLLDLPEGARVLDYGAAKSDTLRKVHAARPDIQPHVFEVSSDYVAAWQGWIPDAAQAVYSVPASWHGRFDAVMSHFVIEHVPDPVGFIRSISELLRLGGTLLLSLPDVSANPGDMTVADHLNHFSEASLRRALVAGGFLPTTIDSASFPGAFFAVAIRTDEPPAGGAHAHEAVERAHQICAFWRQAAANLDEQGARFAGRKAAIYGAGFYGSWIYSRVSTRVAPAAFLDRNPHLQGGSHFGVPVLPPERIPDDIEVLFIGLNPLKAKDVIAVQPWLNRAGLHHVWI